MAQVILPRERADLFDEYWRFRQILNSSFSFVLALAA